MRRACVVAVICGLLTSGVAAAKKPGPALDEILQALERNLQEYDRNVPAFFCEEHASSEVIPGAKRDAKVADSIFRLKREPNTDGSISLAESREVKKVNSHPVEGAEFDLPATIQGAFEGALAVVTASQRACMQYSLRRPDHGRYVIAFNSEETAASNKDCLVQEKAHGRVLIDPGSMQVVHLEITMPRHMIRDESWRAWYPSVRSEWVIGVEYAPVLLDGRTFWMPSEIRSRVTSNPNTFHSTTWLFRASYRNFHKLDVKSRIIPQ